MVRLHHWQPLSSLKIDLVIGSQLIRLEQEPYKPQVLGSSPRLPTILRSIQQYSFCLVSRGLWVQIPFANNSWWQLNQVEQRTQWFGYLDLVEFEDAYSKVILMSTIRAFSLVVRALAAMLETLVRIQYIAFIACILFFNWRVVKLV